jgi:adenine phosphoribosyltransferase
MRNDAYSDSKGKMIYTLRLGPLVRKLPIIPIDDSTAIASFVILGDAELVNYAATAIAPKINGVDLIVTAEAKGIPLAQQLATELAIPRYVVLRKSKKPYMGHTLHQQVKSITTDSKQVLYLDQANRTLLQGKKVAIVDDVISTGNSVEAMTALVQQAGARVMRTAAILAEGDAAQRDNIIYLNTLPLFTRTGEGYTTQPPGLR